LKQFDGIKPSAGKIVVCSVLSFLLGVMQPLAMIFQVMIPAPAVSLAMILTAAMYGSAGVVPVVIYAVTAALSSALMFGLTISAVTLLMWLAPAVVIIIGLRSRKPFFSQLKKGIAAAVAATVAAVMMVAVIYGSDAIAQFIDLIRQNFEAQSELSWQLMASMLNVEMTREEFVELYYSALNTVQLYYEYCLVANLICGAIASACVGVLWGNWKIAKRGMATTESYCGLSQWRLPANTTWGLLLMLAAAYPLTWLNAGSMQSAWVIVTGLCQLAFSIQFLGALNRRMRSGTGYRARAIMMALLMIMGYTSGFVGTMAIIGAVSALFGSQGAAKPWIDKMKNNTNGENR